MENLVLYTDMKGKYKLPLQHDEIDMFNEFVADCQYEGLIKLLGAELYNEFEAGLLISPIAEKWTDLRDGKTFTGLNLCVQNWQGLTNLLVPFVYYKWLDYIQYQTIKSGTIEFKHENAKNATEYKLKKILFKAYNDFYDKYQIGYNFLYSNCSDYDNLLNTKLIRKNFIIKSSIT